MKPRIHPLSGTGALTWRPRSDADQAYARAAVKRQQLQRLLPTIYAHPGPVTLPLKAAATMHAYPDAVITGQSAAALSWWPQLSPGTLTAARVGKGRPVPGFRWEQRPIPDDLVVDHHGLRLTNAALTVLDLIPDKGGNAIDEALRRKACTLADLWRAFELTPGRPGNEQRRILLRDSRDEPWSEAERDLHQHYRACELPYTYQTNFWVSLSDGRRTALDFAIPVLRLAFEADGYQFHGSRGAFEYDRDRDTDLSAQDWQIHRFSASFLDHEGGQVERRIRAIVRHRARHLGMPLP